MSLEEQPTAFIIGALDLIVSLCFVHRILSLVAG